MWTKYKTQKKQQYSGGTWVDVVPPETQKVVVGTYYTFSGCSGYEEEFRWVTIDISDDYICDSCNTTGGTSNYCKYYKQKEQVSYDEGVTWIDTMNFRIGSLYEPNSEDCGYVPPKEFKWKATYIGSTSSAACDSTSAITAGKFNQNSQLLKLEIGDCVTSIGDNACYSATSLSSVSISNSVTTIGAWAFANCSGLTSCTIGSGVTTIGLNAFLGCSSLTSIIIPDGVTEIGQMMFAGCTSLTSCTIGSGVTTIGNYVFQNCSGLTSIDIPNSVTSIGGQAFIRCSGLTNCTIGSGLTTINSNAFMYCSSLSSLTLPDSVTSIGGSAFSRCSGLTSVTVEATTPPTLGTYVFNNTNNCPIYVPSGSINDYKNASGWSAYSSRIQAIP